MKKTIVKLIAVLALCFMVGAVLVACKAEAGPQGEKGDKGDKGDASVVTIVEIEGVKYWAIDGESTGVKAEGVDGNDAVVAECEHENVKSHVLTEHKYDGAVATIGKTLNVCDDCGNAWIVEVGHDYDSVVTEPTCLAAGYTTHTCSICNHTYTDSEVEKLDHKAAVAFDINNPTANGWTLMVDDTGVFVCPCVDDVKYSAPCANYDECKQNEVASAPAAGHVYTPWDETKTVEENVAAGWRLAALEADANPCEWKPLYTFECKHCFNAENDHQNCYESHTEKEKGHTPGDAATCVADQICTECEKVLVEKLGHNFAGDVTIVTAPTYEAAGVATIKCTDCDVTDEIKLNAFRDAEGAGLKADEGFIPSADISCEGRKYQYTYTYTGEDRDGEEVTKTITVKTEVSPEHVKHTDLPDFDESKIADWLAAGGKKITYNGKIYYCYECQREGCNVLVIVHVTDVPATPELQ